MGVPRLFPWLIKNFPEAVKHFQQGEYFKKIDYLYLDANGLLHKAAQMVYNYGEEKSILNRYSCLSEEGKEKKVFSLFFQKIIEMSEIVRPQKLLYIAIDGPAPIAKQSQQRERRFIASRLRLKNEEKKFDSNAITPGTMFMHNLHKFMNYSIREYMNKTPSWQKIKVIFSPPTVPSEGEHKILDYIRILPKEEFRNAKHCMFGPDGDLIMLTLSSHVPNMWLFRQDQYNKAFLHLINIKKVRDKLPEKMNQTLSIQNKKRSLNDVSNDFIILGFFVGNDFLPKIQMFHLLEEGLQFMIENYEYTTMNGKDNFVTINNHLNLDGFKIFIENIAKYEEKFLIEQVTTEDPKKMPPELKFENITLKDTISIENGQYVIDFERYRNNYYEKLHFKKGSLETSIRKMCKSYLRSFIWVFEYYVNGLVDWKWAYEYHYAPLMFDFNIYLQEVITLEDFEEISTFKLKEPSLPFQQLLSVLPSTSSDLLPKFYSKLMTSEKSKLVKKGYYPLEFEVDYEGKLKEYQGVALLPFVDYDVIQKEYEKRTSKLKDPLKYVRNSFGDVLQFQYDKNYRSNYSSEMGNIKNLKVKKMIL